MTVPGPTTPHGPASQRTTSNSGLPVSANPFKKESAGQLDRVVGLAAAVEVGDQRPQPVTTCPHVVTGTGAAAWLNAAPATISPSPIPTDHRHALPLCALQRVSQVTVA